MTGLPRRAGSIKTSDLLRAEGVRGTRPPDKPVLAETPRDIRGFSDGSEGEQAAATEMANARRPRRKAQEGPRGTSHGGVLGIPNPHLIRKPVSRGVSTSAVSDPVSLRLPP